MAASALTRLDESFRRSPVSSGWLVRAQLRGACAAAGDEGFEIGPDRLWAAVIGLPGRAQRDYGALRRGLELYHLIGRLSRRPLARRFRGVVLESFRDELAAVYRLERRLRSAGDGTLAGLVLAATRPDTDRPRSHYRLAMAALCRRRGRLSCIAPGLFPRADVRLTRVNGLARLTANAQRARQDMLLLEDSWRQVHVMISRSAKTKLRQGAALPRLVDLLYGVEGVGSRWGAELLGVSEPQMGRMLARLAELGLVRECTGRGTHRLWVLPDGPTAKPGRPAQVATMAAPQTVRPSDDIGWQHPLGRKRTGVAMPDVDWRKLFADIDASQQAVKRTLQKIE